jgi:phage tail sheath gpL-like
MTTSVVIAGFTTSYKVPGAFRETKYGQGKVSVGGTQIILTVTGNKTSAGSAVADQDIVPIFDEDGADAALGTGSEGALQCYAALAIEGVVLEAAPVAEAAGAAAATLTVTFTGSWSSGGTAVLYLYGKAIAINVSAGGTVTDAAVALVAAINGIPRFFCTAANSSGVVTVTVRSKGVRGNDYIGRKDMSSAPTGLVMTLAGGTALTGGMVPFSGGSGADDVTTVLSIMASATHDFQAWAQNDATNAGLIRSALISEAGPLAGHLEHAIFAKTRSQSTSTSFAQSTLNAYRCTLVHLENCEAPPSIIAAQLAAVRATTVGASPNKRYNGTILPSIPAQSQKSDIATDPELNAMLNSGVMPLRTTPDGLVVIVRAIQSHCLNGSAPDYRTLDWGDADVPDRMSKEYAAAWDVYSENNQYVGDDPDPGEEPPGEDVATPFFWKAEVVAVNKLAEGNKWLQDVDANPPLVEYDDDADRLMTAAPIVVRKQNHQLGISVRQIAA